MYDVVIIGGGITGSSIAYELSKYKLKVALVEKENDALRSKLDSYKSISDETQLMNSDFIIKLRESKCFMRENELGR